MPSKTKSKRLAVFPSFESSLGDNALAAAGACITDGRSRPRPIFGILYINPQLSFSIKNTDIYMKNLLLHEVTHILVFTPILFHVPYQFDKHFYYNLRFYLLNKQLN